MPSPDYLKIYAENQRESRDIVTGRAADIEPLPPATLRIESRGRFSKAADAGACHLNLAGYGARAFRKAPGRYFIWMPKPRTARATVHVMQTLDAQYPNLCFALVDDDPSAPA